MSHPNIKLGATVRDIAAAFPKYKRSKSWEQFEEAYSVAINMLTTPAPQFTNLAVTSKKAEETIRAFAVESAAHRDLIAAAEAAAQYADASIGVEARRALTDVVGLVSEGFDDALDRFRANLNAPDMLSGYESDEVLATFQARQRAANDLDYLSAFRIQLGKAAGEIGTMNSHGAWCYIEAPTREVEEKQPERLQSWSNVISSMPRIVQLPSVSRFSLLLEQGLTLSVGPLGSPETRDNEWSTCRSRASAGPMLTALGEEQRLAALGLPAETVRG